MNDKHEEHQQCSYELVPLVRKPELVGECINLLNEEWPRSATIRHRSMDRCLNETPPATLVLLVDAKNGGGQFLGHARICPLPGPSDHQSQRCWVESVVVWRALRGKGIGQILMEKIEEYSRNLGYGEVCLSTTDKQDFYEKCGYAKCPPVLNIGANSKLFNTLNLNGIFERKNNDKQIDHNSALAPSNLTTDQNGILSSSNDKNPCTKLVTVCSTKKTFMSKAL